MRSLPALLSFVCLAAVAPRSAEAQCLDWSPGFALPGGGVGGGPVYGGEVSTEVWAMTIFDDGSGPALYVAGNFETAGNVVARGIAKWDGTNWSALGSGVYDTVRAMAVFDDGSGPALYVGGNLGLAGGIEVEDVAKWDGSGWSAVGFGIQFSGTVRALAVHDDGTGLALYAGSFFHPVKRWDGSTWTEVGTLQGVDALYSFDDGSGPALYAGTTATGGIQRWDGTAWNTVGTGVAGAVESITSYDDGQGLALYVGGSFLSAGGQPAVRVARWRNSSWSALGSGFSGAIVETLVAHGGVLYAAGSQFSPPNLPNVRAWDGTQWTDLAGGLVEKVHALAVFDDGSGPRLQAGGRFELAGSSGASGLAQWDGASWLPFSIAPGQNGLTGEVYSFATFDDGSGPALHAGGYFSAAGGTLTEGVARWTGSGWASLGGGIHGRIYALAAFDDGTGPALYAGGYLLIGGSGSPGILRWDGTSWSPVGGGVNGYVRALAVYDDGSGPALYAGGHFGIAGGASAHFIAKWNGTSWSRLDSGTSDDVQTLFVWDDGSGPALYAGGPFQLAGGSPVLHIAKWNASGWSGVGNGFGGFPGAGTWIGALAAFDDGSGEALYAIGRFNQAGSAAANGIARWDGTAWSAVPGFVGSGIALGTFDDGSGPGLYLADEAHSPHLFRVGASGLTPVGGGLNERVYALAEFDDHTSGGPDLFVGGRFTIAGFQSTSAITSAGIAKWRGCAGPGVQFCAGTQAVCPCANVGAPGHGCENSAATGGAVLSSAGTTSPDTVVLAALDELPSALSIFLQGDVQIAPVAFGDGARCVGGALKRLYAKNASGGVVFAPAAGEDPITVRSAILGDPIAPGSVRYYQVYYRDPQLGFCPLPQGNAWNVGNALRIQW